MTKRKGLSRRHRPKGVEILYEDSDILVVDKSAGLLTVGTDKVQISLQNNWKNIEKRYLAVVHGKLSHTYYKVIKETKMFSLLEVNLITPDKWQEA